MWFLGAIFLGNIRKWWSQGEFEGLKMFIFISKMKMLKENILNWNRNHFNNIFKEKLDIEKRLKYLNLEIIKFRMNNGSYELEKELLAKQEDILSKEEFFWKQKSWERWLEEGEQNAKYFHNSTLYNRAKSTITSIINNEGIVIDKPTKIAKNFVDHFQKILNNLEGSSKIEQDELLKGIPKFLSPKDKKDINKLNLNNRGYDNHGYSEIEAFYLIESNRIGKFMPEIKRK